MKLTDKAKTQKIFSMLNERCDKWEVRKAYQQEIWGITSRILENTER